MQLNGVRRKPVVLSLKVCEAEVYFPSQVLYQGLDVTLLALTVDRPLLACHMDDSVRLMRSY